MKDKRQTSRDDSASCVYIVYGFATPLRGILTINSIVDLWHRRLRASRQRLKSRAATRHPPIRQRNVSVRLMRVAHIVTLRHRPMSTQCIRPCYARSAYLDHAASPIHRRNVFARVMRITHIEPRGIASMSAQCVRPRYARSAYWSLAYGKARVAAAAIGIYATPIQNSRVAASESVP